MDLSRIWNSDTGQAALNPWPEPLSIPERPRQETQASRPTLNLLNSQEPRETSSPNFSESSTPPANTPNLIDHPEPRAPALSRWANEDFNIPVLDERPPTLMGDEEIAAARKFELYRIHSVEFELKDGDTLVFVDFPATPEASIKHADCNGVVFRSKQFRVHSEKLKATGSSRFIDMFGPTRQFRAQRRRGLVNKLPEGVKYVLDLTPPFEGEDMVFQMTELSLTPGIIKWWTSRITYQVDKWLVDGHDDVCACLKELAKGPENAESEDVEALNSETTSPKAPTKRMNHRFNKRFPDFPFTTPDFIQMRKDGNNKVHDIPSYRNLPDYCPIRHRVGIIRLLMLIEGHTVNLDSAPRIWTLAKLSVIWDCTSVLRDRVTQWMMHGPNSRFIEVLPEEALQIGFALELPEVTRCAFRILVNELALKETADLLVLPWLEKTSAFGRKLGDLPDELSNLVQHSARAFVERISSVYNKVTQFTHILQESEEFRRLSEILRLASLHPSTQGIATRAQQIVDALHTDYAEALDLAKQLKRQTPVYYKSMDLDRITLVEPADFVMTETIVQDLNDLQKYLCPFMYNDLAIELDSGIFYSETRGWRTSRHTEYPKLLGDLSWELHRSMIDHPEIVNGKEWSIILEADNEPLSDDQSPGLVYPLLDIKKLEKEVREILRPIILSWIRYDIEPQLNITRYLLLTLTNNELKYLPLWAGGCNDGSGGVFQSFVPDAELGPNGPGPAYHTGITVPSNPSSISDTMVDDMRTMRVMGSTTAGSVDVHDSISTVYRPDRVIADDVSLASESFTMGGSEYTTARYEVPAEHQGMGQAVEMLVDTSDSESQVTTTEVDFMNDANDEDEDMSFWDGSDDDSDTDVGF